MSSSLQLIYHNICTFLFNIYCTYLSITLYMSDIKRLTPPQSRKVNTLVRRTCCNCDNGNGILLDDGDYCVCPQTRSCTPSFTIRRICAVVVYAVRPLRPAPTGLFTARTAGSVSPADKPQSA